MATFERTESIQDNLNSKKEFVEKYHMQVVKLDDKEITKMKSLAAPVYKVFSLADQKIITAIKDAGAGH